MVRPANLLQLVEPADIYSTLAGSRSCGPQGRSFGHVYDCGRGLSTHNPSRRTVRYAAQAPTWNKYV